MVETPVVIIFMCQLDWAMGCPDIWPNTVLSVFMRMFLERLTSELVDWVKQIGFPNVGGPHPIEDLHRTKELNKKEIYFLIIQLGHWSSPALKWNLYHQLSWFSGLQTWTGTTPLVLLGLQLADCRTWDLSASIIVWANSYHKPLSHFLSGI